MKHAGHCIPLGGDCVICDDKQEGLEIARLRADLAAKDRVLERTRKERDQAVLQLAEAKRPLLPRGRECDGGDPGTALLTRVVFADKVRRGEHVWSDGARPHYCLLCCVTEDGGRIASAIAAAEKGEP